MVNPTNSDSPSFNAPGAGATICRSKSVAIGSMYFSGMVAIAMLSGTCSKLSIETLSFAILSRSVSVFLMMTVAVPFNAPNPYSTSSSSSVSGCPSLNFVWLKRMSVPDQTCTPAGFRISTSTVKSISAGGTTLVSVLMTAALVRVLPHPPE